MRYTKGPWEVTATNDETMGDGGKISGPPQVTRAGKPVRYYVAQYVSDENLNLIAAAPDMYEALNAIAFSDDEGAIGYIDAMTMVRRAMAKAEGE